MNVKIKLSKILSISILFLGILGILLTIIVFVSDKAEKNGYDIISIIIVFGSVYGAFLLIARAIYNSARKKEFKYFNVLDDFSVERLNDMEDASFIEFCEYYLRIKRKNIIKDNVEFLDGALFREMVKRKLLKNEEKRLNNIFTDFGYSSNIHAYVKANDCVIFIERFAPMYKSYTIALANIIKYEVKRGLGYHKVIFFHKEKAFQEKVVIYTLNASGWETLLENSVTVGLLKKS